MAWFRGTRIETAENGVANARANQQAVAKEMEIAKRILMRYHTPHEILRRFGRSPEVQKDLNRIFAQKLGYEVMEARLVKERGCERVELDTARGFKNIAVNELERDVIAEIDLVAHTYAEGWYKKRMEELFPLAYVRAHQSQVHSVN